MPRRDVDAEVFEQGRLDVVDALRLVDIVIANDDEAAVLTGADDPLAATPCEKIAKTTTTSTAVPRASFRE